MLLFLLNFLLQVVQKEREEKLASILKDRLNQYVQENKDGFTSHAEAEVSRLSNAGHILIIIFFSILYSFVMCLPLIEGTQSIHVVFGFLDVQ